MADRGLEYFCVRLRVYDETRLFNARQKQLSSRPREVPQVVISAMKKKLEER